MTKRFTYILAAALALTLGLGSCSNRLEELEEPEASSEMRLYLRLPGGDATVTRVGGTDDTEFGNLDNTTDEQRYIDDKYVLVFKHTDSGTGTLLGSATIKEFGGTNGDASRALSCSVRGVTGDVDVVFLANLAANMTPVPDFTAESMIGKTEKEVYEMLIYNYPDDGQILKTGRHLPMWGKVENLNLGGYTVTGTVPVYRSVAKMSVGVDAACTTFTLKEVYIYYGNNSGYVAAPNKTPDANASVQFSEPDVPASASQFAVTSPQSYTTAVGASTIADIYLAEAVNKGATQPVKVVVGGVFSGEGLVNDVATCYYRIDLEDYYDEVNKQTTETPGAFDIIRNHSYEFNITNVNNPGTPSPEAALDSDVAKIQVVIKAYTLDYMRGVSDQYTLTTDKSVITLASNEDTDARELTIWTDYDEGWDIENISDEEPIPTWLQISSRHGDVDNEITITLKPIGANDGANYGLTRTARFYVVAGNIKKEITFIQPQAETANSYIVDGTGDGSGDAGVYRLIIGLKGNGLEGSEPEGVDILEDDQTVTINPAKIGVIWETHAGLVQLIDANDNVITNTEGSMSYATDFNKDAGTVRYKVNTSAYASSKIGGADGGNALIGAFDEDGNILWSWHIWVAPGLINSDGSVNENYIEKWTLNDYEVMDRNLGALANRPKTYTENGSSVTNSVASMGLLYQWGRKEPFIGANYSNDNFTGHGRIPVVHYYQDWSTIDFEASGNAEYKNAAIRYCTEHPTTLIYGTTNVTEDDGYTRCNGLVNYAQNNAGIQDGGGNYLWGSNKGFENTEVGSKTIYDPCPPGYRVPPVNAFVFSTNRFTLGNYSNRASTTNNAANQNLSNVFVRWYYANQNTSYAEPVFYKSVNPYNDHPNGVTYYSYAQATFNDGTKSSLNQNWIENLTYVPYNPGKNNTSQGRSWNTTEQFYAYRYYGPYLSNADYYGFYLNHKECIEPIMSWDSNNNRFDYYSLDPNQNVDDDISWFPLTGAYDPSQGVSLSSTKIENYSSITVNSFLWTNSSVNKADGTGTRRIPAAMFLHGTEAQTTSWWGTTYSSHGSGRHIHGMNQSNVQARPHFAGAVRCVKDKVKFIWEENGVTANASIKRTKGSTTTISIVSIGGGWELVDPGASWIKVSPNRGTKTGAAGKTITLEVLTTQTAGTSTTLKFQIEGEPEVRTVTVTTTN